jgi:hypothetical protein
MEGSGVFRFDIDCNDGACSGLFYSRRIGRSPQVEPAVPDNGFSSSPSQTTILGASKLTGRIGRFSIGALNAVTSEETARVAGPDGTRLASQPVEPLTSYTVVRARREFANQSSLGVMTTATNRSLPGGMTTLANQAYAAGVDADWRLSKRFRLAGFWAGSTVRGGAEAIAALQESNRHLFQRPDADHVEYDAARTSLNGHSGQVEFSKIGGERLRFSNFVSFKSPGFEINDLGYMRRADQVSVSNWYQVRRDRPSARLRSFRANFNHWRGWNFDGDLINAGINVNAHWEFANSWRTGMGVNVNGRTFDDRHTRGGPGAWRNPTQSLWHYVESDERPAVSVNTFTVLFRDTEGSWETMFEPGVRVRLSSATSVSAGIRFNRNVDDAQWIENVADPGDRYVFGHLDQKTVGLTFRANYTIGPALSLQMYAEPFVSSGHYTGFKELVSGRASAYDDRYAPYSYGGNPDFRYTSFRTTNVLRWEYRPGSALFVVWQQGREGSDDRGRFDLGRDFGHIFASPSSNVFLVKLSYWLNL